MNIHLVKFWLDRICLEYIYTWIYAESGTNNAPILLQNHKHVILSHNNITLKHTIWQFRCNVQIKTINYYTHINTLPTTLKQVLILLDPVFWILSVKKKKTENLFFPSYINTYKIPFILPLILQSHNIYYLVPYRKCLWNPDLHNKDTYCLFKSSRCRWFRG